MPVLKQYWPPEQFVGELLNALNEPGPPVGQAQVGNGSSLAVTLGW